MIEKLTLLIAVSTPFLLVVILIAMVVNKTAQQRIESLIKTLKSNGKNPTRQVASKTANSKPEKS